MALTATERLVLRRVPATGNVGTIRARVGWSGSQAQTPVSISPRRHPSPTRMPAGYPPAWHRAQWAAAAARAGMPVRSERRQLRLGTTAPPELTQPSTVVTSTLIAGPFSTRALQNPRVRCSPCPKP